MGILLAIVGVGAALAAVTGLMSAVRHDPVRGADGAHQRGTIARHTCSRPHRSARAWFTTRPGPCSPPPRRRRTKTTLPLPRPAQVRPGVSWPRRPGTHERRLARANAPLRDSAVRSRVRADLAGRRVLRERRRHHVRVPAVGRTLPVSPRSLLSPQDAMASRVVREAATRSRTPDDRRDRHV